MINVRFPPYSFYSIENSNFFLVAHKQLFEDASSDLWTVNVRRRLKIQRLFEENKFVNQPLHHNLYVEATQSPAHYYFVITIEKSNPGDLQSLFALLDHVYRLCVSFNISQLAISLRDILKINYHVCDEKLIFLILEHLSSQVQFIFHQNTTKEINFYTDRSFEPEELALVHKQKEQLKNIHIERSC